jgi:hypothetical protein
VLRGPLKLAGVVNAYAAELMGWYVSDSKARWREGDPLATLDRPKGKVLQVLIHPIWWGPGHPREKLQRFVGEVASQTGEGPEGANRRLVEHIEIGVGDF